MSSERIRPMTPDDLPAAQRACAATFLEADRRDRRWNDPEPEPPDEAAARAWIEGIGHHVATDPGGCWLAETDGGEIAGLAVAQNRATVWYLAVFAVLPGFQGKGVGRMLIDAALAHAGDRVCLISSSPHPGATRRYRLAGFTLHPLMRMSGRLDRSVLPKTEGLREGRPDDFEWMDALDVTLRGGPHGADHPHMLERMRLIVSSSPGERPGYVYLDANRGGPILLAAAQAETAEKLLWEALAHTSQRAAVGHITTANHWAIDVGLAARLDLGRDGYLAVRGVPEPAPYLASRHHL
ncbi:GNAT family N-acetyltransferase [Actinomadura rubrisoli]|uniref:GNAT family N-acetyltransferase n=1 Tax=Actinomadura rubrisoli TaxID=2530368 RepID=A0A4R5C6H3_9ACTN|nr:GNAT family N-acetyltransferase [Actinomadura rubrisoli]TDD94146.1 GNAT family N-acetyltransferase [Actinomadura rubrisoli]